MIYYIASPYSDPNPAIRQARYEAVMEFCAEQMKRGRAVYSPIMATHPCAVKHNLPKDHEWWLSFDTVFLKHCSQLWVLKMDGWDKSLGVKAEVENARKFGIPVSFISVDGLVSATDGS